MCTHHDAHPVRPGGRAIALEHGHDHDRDHAAWGRRDFLIASGLAALGGAVALGGGASATPLSHAPLLNGLAATETDRVLILVQLAGGNDGLNTIVPFRNDRYYQNRPGIALTQSQTVGLTSDFGMHPAMQPLSGLWGDGKMAALHNVGYDDSSLSHFRGTDIWMSGSGSDEVVETGWAGRSLATEFPGFFEEPPDAPPAVQMGTHAPLLFQGPGASYSMALLDVELFLQIAGGESPYETASLPSVPWGQELGFVRTVANDAFRYRNAIETASQAADNAAVYPDTGFGNSLAAVARLIKGRLGTRIYLVSLDGFDTHANQPDRHANLLGQLAQSMAALQADLTASGDADRVLTMTFSEFGRRVEQNGSTGTDHGTAAPLFLFGNGVLGGLQGEGPDLVNLDSVGNLHHEFDYRQIYSTVLGGWLGLDEPTVTDVLGGSYAPLPVLNTSTPAEGTPPTAPQAAIESTFPNPLTGPGRVVVALPEAGAVRIEAFDALGRRVALVHDGDLPAGASPLDFDASAWAAGTYVLRLTAGDHADTHRIQVVR